MVKGKNQGEIVLTNTCIQCKKEISITVQEDDFKDWQEGTLIQHAFPYLNAEQREFLISEYCGPCFDNLFEDEDE